jgi:dTDP-4-dehydrorhamnose reductase
MRVLVTGGHGQLASTIVDHFATRHEVVSRARTELDLTDETQIQVAVREIRPDVVVNCAAYNDVDGAEDHPERALSVNAFGLRSLASAARAVGATLVHYSSDFVFDGNASEPYTEEDRPNPQSVYATSKLLGEWFAANVERHYVLRVESLFGGGALGPDPLGRRRGSAVDRMADAILAGREVRAFMDRVVSPSYVDDVADATEALLDGRAPYGLYHCVGTGYGTWHEVAIELAHGLRVEPPIERVRAADLTFRASRPLYCALSNVKLAAIGIEMPTWQDAIGRYTRLRQGH